MRKGFLFLAMAWACSSAVQAAAAPDVITRNLKSWSPQAVTLERGVLTVVTGQDRVTDQIYTSVLGSGVCGSLWMNPGSWSGVKEVKVLNRHARQGYVFEGGEAECVELGKLNGEAYKFFILERTRWN